MPSACTSSALASLLSLGRATPGSGAGLQLLLCSCLMGEASAMELWLLLSSAEGQRHRMTPVLLGKGRLGACQLELATGHIQHPWAPRLGVAGQEGGPTWLAGCSL